MQHAPQSSHESMTGKGNSIAAIVNETRIKRKPIFRGPYSPLDPPLTHWSIALHSPEPAVGHSPANGDGWMAKGMQSRLHFLVMLEGAGVKTLLATCWHASELSEI